MNMDRRTLFFLGTGILLFVFSNGNYIIPLMAWVAPIFLLIYLRGPKRNFKLLLLFILFVVATKIMLNEIIPNSIGALTYILTVYYALIWFFPYWMHALLGNRNRSFVYTLVFPTAAILTEYLNTVFYGSWGSLAYTQFGNLPLMQLASLTGIWGLTFLIMWFASVVDWCSRDNNIWPRIISRGWIYASAFLGVMLYGGIRLLSFQPEIYSQGIVSFTPSDGIAELVRLREERGFNSTVQMSRESRDELTGILDDVHRSIFNRMDQITGPAHELVLWPEAGMSVLREQEQDFIEAGMDFAKRKSVFVMLAYYLIPENGSGQLPENKSVMITPDGRMEYEYLKAYPVPGAGHKAGEKQIPVIETSMGRIGTAICYDMDFTHLIHQAGRKDVDIMIVPAWDWEAIDPLHTHMAAFRGIENGFSVVRQTGEGLSMATDPTGRVLAYMDHFTSPEHVMISSVPVKRYPTIYAITGDLFAWISIAVFLVMMVNARRNPAEAK